MVESHYGDTSHHQGEDVVGEYHVDQLEEGGGGGGKRRGRGGEDER